MTPTLHAHGQRRVCDQNNGCCEQCNGLPCRVLDRRTDEAGGFEITETNPTIKDRLTGVFQSILCPMAGCWMLHGGHSEYYFDTDAESHVLEVWPVGIEEPEEHGGNGNHQADQGLLYELAEFDFLELAKEIPLEHFHFSQRRSIFEIGWKEDGQQLELRVHIVPVEVAED